MADVTRDQEPKAPTAELLPWADKVRFQKLFARQAARSYLYLSFGMGLLALLLPVALLLAGGYAGHYSISYFYHVNDLSRNILVGALCATGVFLFLFQGLSRWENMILNLAGVAAIGVAFLPMPPAQCAPGSAMTLHAASAIVFFLSLAVVAIGFAKTRIRFIIFPPKRERFKRAYDLAGLAMIAMPLAVVALYYLGGRRCETHWIFWVEVLGIWAFAAYWFIKTAEYKLLLRVRWVASQRERREREAAAAGPPPGDRTTT